MFSVERFMQQGRFFYWLWNHPLNQHARIKAIIRFLRWQIGSRLLGREVLLPFVDDKVLLVSKGMTGATGNYYCGLHEHNEMAFVLHTLRDGDLFVDVGANVGSYTILAAHTGANVISVEPIPYTFNRLKKMIAVNLLSESQVDAHCIGLADKEGQLVFTAGLDTTNHVLYTPPSKQFKNTTVETITAPVLTLDILLQDKAATMIKIDVEGFEHIVLKGATSALKSEKLLALIIEMNGNNNKYGIGDQEILDLMAQNGFSPFSYAPFDRKLQDAHKGKGNTIFCSTAHKHVILQRIVSAPKFGISNGIYI
ncbi:hypothetical protein TH9_06745 [Thalassospira xiamenensis]|uniref:FkbM family methyltransferase n=1 Tax=Thalassospira xiamenensis TaxID=220697 RepID=UPI000DED955F|nr:FkbM family methyltransferase [Thalassospira xiamenensis]RCK34080.1 hypothetical protein TH9_06745 [Thalassospira xiamenensis]